MTTMEQSIENPANIRGVCFCCLADGSFKNMYQSFKWIDHSEVYADMMLNCYNISIGDVARDTKPLICEVCIVRLRDSLAFRKQVENSCEVMKNATSLPETNVFELPIQKWEGDEEEDSFNWDDTEAREDPHQESKDSVYIIINTSEIKDKKKIIDDKAKMAPKTRNALRIEDETAKSTSKANTTVQRAKKITLKKNTTIKKDGLLTLPTRSLEKKIDYLRFEDEETAKSTSKASTTAQSAKKITLKKNTTIKKDGLLTLPTRSLEKKNDYGLVFDYARLCPFRWHSGKFICAVCDKRCPGVAELNCHMETHAEENVGGKIKKYHHTSRNILYMEVSILKCTKCQEEFTKSMDFKEHILEKHKADSSRDFWGVIQPIKLVDTFFLCQACDKSFLHFFTLLKHLNSHADFKCQVCGKAFINLVRMNRHAKRMHTDGVFPCKKCEHIFPSLARLDNHMMATHRKSSGYRCQRCSALLPSFLAKMRHMVEVHNEEPNRLECDFCHKRFMTMSMLTSHKNKVHVKARNHICEVCGRGFFNAQMLRDHSTVHTGAKPYTCLVCSKKFPRAYSYREHMKIHNNIKKFVCTVCPKAFVQKCALKSHLYMHEKRGEL